MIKLGKTEIPYKYPYMEYRGLVISGPMDLIVLLLYIYCTCSGMWVGLLWKHSLQHEGQLLLLLEVARHGTHEKSENKSKIIASTTTTKFISLCAVWSITWGPRSLVRLQLGTVLWFLLKLFGYFGEVFERRGFFGRCEYIPAEFLFTAP